MTTFSKQRGAGLVEILVALLVLMLGVLGFVALQYRAVEATTEGGARIQAINLARDFAERIRVNRGAMTDYISELQSAKNQSSSDKDCSDEECTASEMADYDVAQITKSAEKTGMAVNLLKCQGNSDARQCIYVAWGDTAPTNGSNTNEGDCTVAEAYDPASTCLIMEVY
ncbi:type IV pilus modification protein PilV [Acinetobacter sp. CIP 102637]|uniref:type IV pilus modification protein PilV n=1 Tax=Acinetobacter sp. CIP 102637 TaxID=1144669 RepID=UPI0002D02E53|nr:type IV pilus modification protein PilV [Acinetobacter sp. CIP 102637]ENV07398.1 type IV pilus modification protein PilV [Acinetobacter sp. CIP 102637]